MSILEPISQDLACGVDYKYDDSYLEIEIEIEKSFNVTSDHKIDWELVVSKCENILTNHSKDLKIASYWLYAQWHLNDISFFLNALTFYSEFIEKYQKDLYPLAGRRKEKVLEWLEKVFEGSLLSKLEYFSRDQLEEIEQVLATLERVIPLCVESDYSFLKEVGTTTKRFIEQIKQKEVEAKKQAKLMEEEEAQRREQESEEEETKRLRCAEEESVLKKFSSPSMHTITKVQISGEDFVSLKHEDVEETIEPWLIISKQMFEKAPTDYLAFKVLFSLGETLLEEALHDTSVQKDDFIPSEEVCQVVRQLGEQEHIAIEQLRALQDELFLRPTWLEGYYIASKVLYKLEKSEDAEKLENLLLYFLHRKETLLELHVGETLLVKGKMLSWAKTKLLSLCDDGGNSVEYERAYQEVLTVKNEQSTQNALDLLEAYYQKASGDEERFRWRYLFVELALEMGDKSLALSLLFELERQIDFYHVEKWQPELAIKIYETLLKPIISQELGNDGKERVYHKLSVLDIQKVIKL